MGAGAESNGHEQVLPDIQGLQRAWFNWGLAEPAWNMP
jgi:hypothetical protein